tara:strand:+ start:70 stop:192 length:123 start_codon:yes stop_codon:yes gene_type:complete
MTLKEIKKVLKDTGIEYYVKESKDGFAKIYVLYNEEQSND